MTTIYPVYACISNKHLHSMKENIYINIYQYLLHYSSLIVCLISLEQSEEQDRMEEAEKRAAR